MRLRSDSVTCQGVKRFLPNGEKKENSLHQLEVLNACEGFSLHFSQIHVTPLNILI